MNVEYYHKYIKYKTKYIELSNNNQAGGAKNKLSRLNS